LYDVPAIADEVRVLEEKADDLQTQLEDWVLDAAGRLDDPSRLRGLLHLASATEVVSDAALGIAEVVLRDVDMPAVYAEALDNADEIITSARVGEDGELVGTTTEDLLTNFQTGMVVLAIRRGDDWLYDPAPESTLQAGDVLYACGPPVGEHRLRERAGD
jgi:uncharacterized protein with PhoU and TrkA domain